MWFDMNLDFIFLLIGIILISMSVLGTTLSHEEVHKLIFKNFGVDSNLSFSLNELRFFTNANQTDWEGLTNEARQQIKLENSINESIGYNTGNYLIAIMGILLFGFFYLGSKIK